MTRSHVIGALAAALVVVALAAVLVGGDHGSTYRVAAIFDSARGMVPGQQVKVAGAAVGSVSKVQLTADRKARIVMSIERRAGSFRADARCTILPEGLISENFVQCDPGHAPGGLPRRGGVPTVPVAHTTVPVSLQDMLNVFSLPTDDRIRVLLNELGIATAGRGTDLNQVLRRANPALADADRLLAVLDAQRQTIGRSVDQTHRVLAAVAGHDRDLRRFVGAAADVTRETSRHAHALTAATERMPALLDAARPSLTSIDAAARRLSPLLDDVRGAGPQLGEAVTRLRTFSNAGVPAMRSLDRVATTARPALRAVLPRLEELRRLAPSLRRGAGQLATLLTSTRDSGGFEGLWRVLTGFAAATSLHDSQSHVLSAMIALAPQCVLSDHERREVAGCDRRFDAAGQGTIPVNAPKCGPQPSSWGDARCPIGDVLLPSLGVPVRSSPAARRGRPKRAAPRPGRGDEQGGPESAPAQTTPAPGPVPQTTPAPLDGVKALLDYLLR